MRQLVEDRVRACWCEDMGVEFDMAYEDIATMSDEDLLAIYEELFGFNG